MTLSEIFSKDYLFNPNPPYQSNLYLPLSIFFGFLLILAILTRFMKPEYKRLVNRYYYCFITAGILGYVYLFARYEGLSWLGSRFTLLFVISTLIIWLLYNTISIILYVPKYKKAKDTLKIFEQYLPKPASAKASAGRPAPKAKVDRSKKK